MDEQEKFGFWEKAANKVITAAVRSKLRRANDVQVQIKTDLNKLTKGQLDSMTIAIYGELLASGVEADVLRLQIGRVTVRPLSAMRGKINLVHPSEGMLHLVIDQEKCTTALNPESLLEQLRSHPGFEAAMLIGSLSDGTITVKAVSPQNNPDKPLFVLVATLEISPERQAILLQQLRYIEGQEPSSEFTQALLTHIDQLLSLSDFARQGVRLRIQQLDVSAGKLTLDAVAEIEQFPSS